ncbi:MAG TPA: hypothetical protein PLU55_01520 [Candidatus Pacearchaeota archaeon]|nr:hypothetical protein [Candidatus Pacearchaeota archaeon]
MLRNFEKFEVGHYYVYTGSKTEKTWCPFGGMNFAIEHKILQCCEVHGHTNANFKENERLGGSIWAWKDGFDNWVEVESPEAVFEIGDKVLQYVKNSKTWKERKLSDCLLVNNQRKNGYDTFDCFYYILKRKPKEKDDKILGVDNPFKKYIRQKKYLTFGKKKSILNKKEI